jgi:hypothetical protein
MKVPHMQATPRSQNPRALIRCRARRRCATARHYPDVWLRYPRKDKAADHGGATGRTSGERHGVGVWASSAISASAFSTPVCSPAIVPPSVEHICTETTCPFTRRHEDLLAEMNIVAEGAGRR